MIAHAQLGLLYLAPAVALVLLLAAGRYPGEQALERLRARLQHPPRRPRRLQPAGGARRPAFRVAAGGRLVTRSVAPRGPPVVG